MGSFTHPVFPSYNMHFNKRIWAELQLPCPYELVLAGEWTWEKMQEFALAARLDRSGTGTFDSPDDRYGIVQTGEDFVRAMFFSMGEQIYRVNPATGRVELAVDNPQAYEKVEWMRRFHQTPGMITGGPDWLSLSQVFLDGNALFISSQVDTPRLREMDDDFGMLPMPKWNKEQPKHISSMDHNGTLIGIPLTNNANRDATGYILDALGRGFVSVNNIRMQDYMNTIYRSEEDEDMLLDVVVGTTYVDLVLFLKEGHRDMGLPMRVIVSAMGQGGESDVPALMEQIKVPIEWSIAEFFGYDPD
jgi:hypothetical protein